ncbi:hypothetical protein [Streptomyces sp. NPDC058751]|uniref:hypothetical protein n=1 Tax=Streptomyces sp. NPDC058751 TaxID=3346623 RepID=UPI0036871BF6
MNEQWQQRQRPRVLGPAGTWSGSGHAPQPAVLVHELVAAAGGDGERARDCARRLAALLPPEARTVLLDALTRTGGTRHDDGDGEGYGDGGGLFFDGPEYPVPSSRSVLSLLPAHRAPDPAGPAGDSDAGTGDGGPWPKAPGGAPAAVVRLRFTDPDELERAGAHFDGAWSEPGTGVLQVPADAGVETVRAVLAVLDSAGLAPESLTVHTNELDDVFAAFTGLL